MNHATPNGPTVKKLLVVGLLACLLLVVLWQNLSGSSNAASATAVLATTTNTAPTPVPRITLSQAFQNWPAVELPQLLAHNPFQSLELPAEPAVPNGDASNASGPLLAPASAGGPGEPAARANVGPSLQINAILSGGRRPAVLIGQRLYFERDEIAGEWRILAIHPNRVALEPLASSSAQPVAVSWSANGGQSPDNDQADQNQTPQ